MNLSDYFKRRAELEERKYLTENRQEWARRTGNHGLDGFDQRISMDTERELSELDKEASENNW